MISDRFAGRYFTTVPKSIERGVKHIGPIIRERYENMEKYGDNWQDKPVCMPGLGFTKGVITRLGRSQNDMLQWLMDIAEGEEREIRALVMRILTINFAAIHTSSNVGNFT